MKRAPGEIRGFFIFFNDFNPERVFEIKKNNTRPFSFKKNYHPYKKYTSCFNRLPLTFTPQVPYLYTV